MGTRPAVVFAIRSKQMNSNQPSNASTQAWMKPELVRLGTIGDVAAKSPTVVSDAQNRIS